ncbi:hypothetical protein DFP72DRAFT_860103 [Ephemerocybe angulata]|uniref:Uncharacterized protein n=1 Tax=Ephemerocybe angulata TaxID=980116 RepID=A0A8H6LVJ0_9AGAR|nr:hypothetical protein DFP72DRAFT_860103 [Tulosesus angulatus]
MIQSSSSSVIKQSGIAQRPSGDLSVACCVMRARFCRFTVSGRGVGRCQEVELGSGQPSQGARGLRSHDSTGDNDKDVVYPRCQGLGARLDEPRLCLRARTTHSTVGGDQEEAETTETTLETCGEAGEHQRRNDTDAVVVRMLGSAQSLNTKWCDCLAPVAHSQIRMPQEPIDVVLSRQTHGRRWMLESSVRPRTDSRNPTSDMSDVLGSTTRPRGRASEDVRAGEDERNIGPPARAAMSTTTTPRRRHPRARRILTASEGTLPRPTHRVFKSPSPEPTSVPPAPPRAICNVHRSSAQDTPACATTHSKTHATSTQGRNRIRREHGAWPGQDDGRLLFPRRGRDVVRDGYGNGTGERQVERVGGADGNRGRRGGLVREAGEDLSQVLGWLGYTVNRTDTMVPSEASSTVRKPTWWLVLGDEKQGRVVVPPIRISDIAYADSESERPPLSLTSNDERCRVFTNHHYLRYGLLDPTYTSAYIQ